jgi:O-antigen biosynthesis protein
VKTNIVVPVFNQPEDLRLTVRGLFKNTPRDLYRLWLVDNGSAAETTSLIADIQAHDPETQVVRSETNLGFPGGNNLALRRIRSGHVCFLNSDTYCTPGWLEHLLAVLEIDSSIGLVGPVTNGALEKYEQKVVSFSAPLSIGHIETTSRRLRLEALQENRPYVVVDHPLMFFCTLVREEAFAQIGLLDERFGLGCEEDNDYCIRAHLLGWTLAVAHTSFVFHQRQKTYPRCFTDVGSAVRAYTANHAYLQQKHAGARVTPGFQRFLDAM